MSIGKKPLRPAQNLATMSSMNHNRQGGYIDKLLIPLVVILLLFLGTAGFGVWAYMERQDYKNNSDQKAAAAAAEQKKATQAEEAAKYAEEAKSPLKTFAGPSDFGSVTFEYPKTWSGYVVSGGNTPLNGYFQPDIVPNVENEANSFALRVAVVEQSYSKILSGYNGDAKEGSVTVSPYASPKVEGAIGTRIDGEIVKGKRGSMVIFPVRNVTLQVWTEADQYVSDFNNIILPNLTFAP